MAKKNKEVSKEIEITPEQRFLSDPQVHKTISNLISTYHMSYYDHEDVEEELPEASRDERLVISKAIFHIMEDVFPNGTADSTEDDDFDPDNQEPTNEEEDDEEYAAFKAEYASVGIEVAKDKKMSQYYRAFMGSMRELVNPWHSNRNLFRKKWAELGNSTVEKSPADEKDDEELLTITCVTADAQDSGNDSSNDSSNEESDTEFAGLAAHLNSALPGRVAKVLRSMGFVPDVVDEDDEINDAIWRCAGDEAGHPELEVMFIKRDDDSYIISLNQVSSRNRIGKHVKRLVLSGDSGEDKLLRSVAYMYDLMGDLPSN